MNTLVIDIGGSHVKCLASGESKPRRIRSGRKLTPRAMVDRVCEAAAGWSWDRVAIGYPGVVCHDRTVTEPANLGKGWVGFDYEAAFGKPVRMINDASMQALGSYQGGRMLFLGLGTGLGSAMIVDGEIQPLELAHLPYKKGRTFEDYVGRRGLERLGKKRWRRAVLDVVERLQLAMLPDYTVLGGGEVELLGPLPAGVRRGSNDLAFRGGFLLWEDEDARSGSEPARESGTAT